MASNTPIKRASPSEDDNNASLPPGKKQKSAIFGNEPDYSSGVRKKYTTATRTGQACDRCKERKMRCDPNPAGCEPCRQKGIACLVTDRVTGNTGERGEMERLRREISDLKEILGVYQQKHGMQDIGNGYTQPASGNGGFTTTTDRVQAHQMGLLANYANTPAPAAQHSPDTSEEIGPCAGPVRGSKVSMLGFEIDTAKFVSSDLDEPTTKLGKMDRLYNKSKTSVLRTLAGMQPMPETPALPPKATANSYVGWYFLVVNPYAPVLHEPTFKALLSRMFEDPSFTPTPAESAVVYMVFAIFTYQLAVRSPKDPESHAKSSNNYFHYALSFFPELLLSDDLSSLQALSLMCLHTRNFPKASFSWLICQHVYSLCIDLGLHRSVERVAPKKPRNFLENEMFKRVFWTVLTLLINVGAKQGKPMPLSMNDIDVELPILAQDHEITPEGLKNLSGTCPYRVGIHTFRIVPVVLEMYNQVINVRRPAAAYTETVNRLEKKITDWLEQWKQEGSKEDARNQRVFTIYVESWACEYRLLLHHPDVCTSTSPDILQKNFEICHRSSKMLLSNVQELYAKFVGLDFSSQNLAVYVLAAATSMYLHLKTKDSITQAKFDALEHEMKSWLGVMASAGKHLGAGDQLYNDLKQLVDHGTGELRNILLATSALENGGYQHQVQTGPGPDVYNGGYADRTPIQNTISPQQPTYTQEQVTYPEPAYSTTIAYHQADPSAQYATHTPQQNHYQQPEQQQQYIQTTQPWGAVNVSGYHANNHTASALLSLAQNNMAGGPHGVSGVGSHGEVITAHDGALIDASGVAWPNTMIPGHGLH